MVLLVGLGKLVKRIWKNSIYRWSLSIICTVVFFATYDYLHSIIAHTIIHTSMLDMGYHSSDNNSCIVAGRWN